MDFDGFRMEDWKICIHGFFLVIFPYQAIFFPQNENRLYFFYYLCSHLNTKDQL